MARPVHRPPAAEHVQNNDNDNEATAVTALGSVRTIDLDKSTPAITSPRPPTLEEAASLRLEVDQSNG